MTLNRLAFVLYCLISYIQAYTDPAVLNPQLVKRFEYKLSFKGPHLAFKDGTVPFWTFGGSAIASDEQIRVTPSIRSQRGWVWSKTQLEAENWVVDVKLRINGRGRIGADGMAIWFTEKSGVEGNVFGSNDLWNGLGIFLDSFDNDGLQNNPIIAAMINDGTKNYDHQHDGSSQIQGSCIRDFRNKPFPVRLKIEYIKQILTIYVNNGITQDDNAFEFCARIENVQLPKSGYLGVSAETGGLADDHDVLEFLTNTYTDKQISAPNQAATDEQMQKYKEEYSRYEEELKKQQADYQREHPEASTRLTEQQLYESEYDREFRTILEGQDQIRMTLTNIDSKMIELLGRIERLSMASGGQQQISGQPGGGNTGSNLPTDVARVQDINRVINANTEITRNVQSFGLTLTDLQQKLNVLQANVNNIKSSGTAQQLSGGNVDATVMNEVRETLRLIKSDTHTIIQRSSAQVKCPTLSEGDTACLGPYTFFAIIVVQFLAFIGYFTFKNRQDQFSRKYL